MVLELFLLAKNIKFLTTHALDSLYFQVFPGHIFMRGHSLAKLAEHGYSAADIMVHSERGQVNVNFPCSADHEQDRQPYPVDPFPAT